MPKAGVVVSEQMVARMFCGGIIGALVASFLGPEAIFVGAIFGAAAGFAVTP